MSADMYASPDAKNVASVVFGTSLSLPGVVALAAAKSTTFVLSQNPSPDPEMSGNPGTFTLLTSPKQVTSM